MNWQGWQDSDLRMHESKSCALPLGYTPIGFATIFVFKYPPCRTERDILLSHPKPCLLGIPKVGRMRLLQ